MDHKTGSTVRGMSDKDWEAAFNPQEVAFVGISESASGSSNNFIRLFQRLGFTGRTYPVHLRVSEGAKR